MKKLFSAFILSFFLGAHAFAVGSVVGGGGGEGSLPPQLSVDNTSGTFSNTVSGTGEVDAYYIDNDATVNPVLRWNPTNDGEGMVFKSGNDVIAKMNDNGTLKLLSQGNNDDYIQFVNDSGNVLSSFVGNGQGISSNSPSYGIFGWNNNATGPGGHVQLVSGDSQDDNAGDIILTPGFSVTNGIGNVVLQDKDQDQWITLWGNNGLQFRHNEDRGIRWYDQGSNFVVSILPPETLTGNLSVRWFGAGGSEGDVVKLGPNNQLVFEAAGGGGGGETCATFTPNASYSTNITWTGLYCYTANHLRVHYEGITTGGGGGGSSLVLDLPNGYTLDTGATGYPNAGTSKFLKLCSGVYSYGSSTAYDTMAAPKASNVNTLAVYYRDSASSNTWNDVANNAPNSQSSGILYTIDCPDIAINE